jgi:hypothetical protein
MKSVLSNHSACSRLFALPMAALLGLLPTLSQAGPFRGRSVNRNVNVNRNTNVNVNRNVRRDVDININRRYHGHHNNHHHGGFGAGVAAGAIAGIAIGAAVAAPPRGYHPVYVGPVTYAYHGGVFYQPAPSGYVVIAPPVGAIVPVLPPGAAHTVINGVSYYVVNTYYYQPVLVSGVTQYRVVRL